MLGSIVEVCRRRGAIKAVPEFKSLGCILDESGTDDAKCRRKVVSRRKVECTRVLHEALLVTVLMYGSGKIVWKEYERSMIMAM